MNGVLAHQDDAICRAWQAHYDRSEGNRQQCLVTGGQDVIEAVHPAVKGVDGAQSSGAAIVSFNAPAFCSYGREQNYNAPVGKYAAFAYTAALNRLLADRENVQKIGDTTVVCWAEDAEPQYRTLTLAALFGTQEKTLSEDDVRSAVRRLAEGLPVRELRLKPEQPFYILGLSPNAARLSVRFFYRGAFGDLMKNINAHHERMEIVRPGYDAFETIPLWAMLRETVNPNARDKTASPVLAGATARAIFTGGLYPAALLEQTMLRIRAERDVTRGKAAIIVGIHNDEGALQRTNELTPKGIGAARFPSDLPQEWKAGFVPEGEIFDDFVVNTVMPAVQAQFPVMTDRNHTAFCGSSSGGLQAYFTALSHADRFCISGVFSPAFVLYDAEDIVRWTATKTGAVTPYLYIYSGAGDQLEREIFESTETVYDAITEFYPPEKLSEVLLPDQPHNESAWAPIFKDFLHTFLLRGEEF